MENFKKLTINKKAENSLRAGHSWVYKEELLESDAGISDGEMVNVFSSKNKYLGTGFYNSRSKILVRIISDNANDSFDYEFFKRRLRYAIAYRKTVMKSDFSCCRLIFGDADRFPGLIIDKFENVIVAQIMCLGIERIKDMLFEALREIMREYNEEIELIYERNDVKVREKEGLPLYKAVYGENSPSPAGTVRINENGILYDVDYINGQKTGFFLDQKYNRRAAAAIAEGMNVLDCFTHTGAFALNCAAAGAKKVTAVDISEEAIRQTKHNARLNNIDNIEFACCDVFNFLDSLYSSGKQDYNYIILDPPAFTKSRNTIASAYRGYKEINLKAMRILPRGGYLASCSCSHFMTDALFRKMLGEAAADAKVQLRIIEYRQQACDHPVVIGIPETEYLKFYILQVV